MHPVPFVLHPVLNVLHAPSEVDVVSSAHVLSVQAVVEVAVEVFQHFLVKPEHSV